MNENELKDYLQKLHHLDDDINGLFDKTDSDDFTEELNKLKEVTNVLSLLESDVKNKTAITSALDIKIKLLHPNAVIPTYSKYGDAGMDLYITDIIKETTDKITYGYGIAIEIPEGYVGLLFPRSSISKMDLLMTNSVGVIDSGYRGEVMSVFYKTNDNKYSIGDRGAQLLIIPYPYINFVLTDELSKTERNEGGFGHTGK